MNDGSFVEALKESNDILQEEVSRLREMNSTLRVVIRALRRTNESLRQQVSNAAENDDTFKRFCAGEFDEIETLVEQPEEGALLDLGIGGTIGLEQ